MIPGKILNNPYLSPLRYPGGKRWLAPIVLQLLANKLGKSTVFLEPFAGGASISLALLESGHVERIGLFDRDHDIPNFWRIVFSEEAATLADKVATTEVSVALRNSFVAAPNIHGLLGAFRFLYLNRTSYSGITHKNAGPIGGQSQSGKYKIDCRFNREAIANRILQLSKLRERVVLVEEMDFRESFQSATARFGKDCVWYLDPPFFRKADRLYRHSFVEQDHLDLHALVKSLSAPYVLSYDGVDEALALFDGVGCRFLVSKRTTFHRAKDSAPELLVTNNHFGNTSVSITGNVVKQIELVVGDVYH